MDRDTRSLFEVVTREDFSDVTFLLEVHHPRLASAALPGQFVIVMLREQGERIPLTIADFDRERGTITLVIQAVGKTTREMQQECQVGTRLHAVVGPMGIPSHDGQREEGGVRRRRPRRRAGIPAGPRPTRRRGAYVIGVLGFRSRDLVFWEDKFRAVLRRTDHLHQRRLGRHQGPGHRRASSRAIAKHPDIDEVVAIGPPIMMKACAEATRPHKIKTMVSVNPIMVDGTGMCGGCRVKVGDKVQVRLRRRARLRRPPGGLRRPDVAAAPLHRARSARALRALVARAAE